MALIESVESLTSRLSLDNPELHDSAVRTFKCLQLAKAMLFDSRVNNFDGADVVALARLIQEGAQK